MLYEIEGFEINIPDNYQKVPLPYFDEWVRELETTDLPQGHGQLELNGGYCCLGILCKLQGRLNTHEQSENEGLIMGNPCYGALHDIGLFTGGVRVTKDGEKPAGLAGVNDMGMSFKGIAALINLLYKKS